MNKVKVDFKNRELVRIRIESITVGDREVKCVNSVDESHDADKNIITINTCYKTGITIHNLERDLLVVKCLFKDVKSGEEIEIDSEYRVKNVLRVDESYSNGFDCPTGDYIELSVGEAEHYTYVKDEIEQLQEEVKKLKSRIKGIEIENDKLRNRVTEQSFETKNIKLENLDIDLEDVVSKVLVKMTSRIS